MNKAATPDLTFDQNSMDIDLIFGEVPPGGEFVMPPDNPVLEHAFDQQTSLKIGQRAYDLINSGEWDSILTQIIEEATAPDGELLPTNEGHQA